MAESNELFNEIAVLRDEVEEQGAMLDALVRASVGDRLVELLRKDQAAINVLLAVDGVRSQTEIVDHLRSSGDKGASAASVSRKLKALGEDYGLVALSHRAGSGNVYHRTRLDRALRVSRTLERGR
jgi:hypothetical protein